MGFLAYLRSAVPSLALTVVADALCALVLLVSRSGAAITILVCSIVSVGALTALLGDYAKKRSFFTDLACGAADAKHPLWITEMIERPDYLEGVIAYDAMRAIAKAANDDVAAGRRQAIEYREYIETWVHEAKSPLAAAHLMIENLEDDSAAASAPAHLAALGEELDRVEGYIDQALFYARSEAVERDYLIRRYDLRHLVSTAIKANAASLIAARVTPVREGLDRDVFTDEKWIEFILGQLIQNSIKYARADEARISFAARLEREGAAGERVVLSIEDNGCGVSAADLPRVFDKGFTGENGRSGKRSTGIGLYLVKRLCDKMGVGIAVDSRPGRSFTVRLAFSTNPFRFLES